MPDHCQQSSGQCLDNITFSAQCLLCNEGYHNGNDFICSNCDPHFHCPNGIKTPCPE
eukprot:Pgem_evm1s17608